MNKRQQAILDELADLDDKIKERETDISKLKERRSKVWARGHRAGIEPADLAAASRVKPVTIRQWRARRVRAEQEKG